MFLGWTCQNFYSGQARIICVDLLLVLDKLESAYRPASGVSSLNEEGALRECAVVPISWNAKIAENVDADGSRDTS